MSNSERIAKTEQKIEIRPLWFSKILHSLILLCWVLYPLLPNNMQHCHQSTTNCYYMSVCKDDTISQPDQDTKSKTQSEANCQLITQQIIQAQIHEKETNKSQKTTQEKARSWTIALSERTDWNWTLQTQENTHIEEETTQLQVTKWSCTKHLQFHFRQSERAQDTEAVQQREGIQNKKTA